jgi:Raf kinase inhibitor-like YbhB/YbcL family protein
MNAKPILSIVVSSAVVAGYISIAGCGGGGGEAHAQLPVFTVTSPDLASGTFATQYILNGFGCTGGNISPAVTWTNPPAGTKSFVLNVFDPDAPTGSGFWHWAVYNIPATATGLARGAGNSPATLPAPAFGGTTDLLDTGTTGGNGNYGGPCPPAGDAPHRYIFTLYALSVDDVQVAGGVPKTGTAGLYSFAINKGIGAALIAKTTFTATYGR